MIEYKLVTFEKLMSKNMDNIFHQVTCLSYVIAQKQQSSFTFLSQFSAYFIHKIMVLYMEKHHEVISFDRRFTKNILIINNTMVDFDYSNLQEVAFNEDSCTI